MLKKFVAFICTLLFALTIIALSISFRNKSTAKASENFFGKPVWAFKSPKRIVASLLDENSRLFIQTQNSIYSLDVQTGNILWQTELNADTYMPSPMLVSGDILLAQGRNAMIAAYSANSGQLLWQDGFSHGDWIEDMATYENNLYVARYSTSLTVYQLDSGEILWSPPVPDRSNLFLFTEKGKVYLGTDDSLRIYDTQQLLPSKLLEEVKLDDQIAYMEKAGNTLYIANYHEKGISLSAFNFSTLEKMWDVPYRQLPGLLSVNSMVISENILYVIGEKTVAISTNNGTVQWISDKDTFYKKSVIASDAIYAINDTNLSILDKDTGKELRLIPLPGSPLWMPLLIGLHSNMFFVNNYAVIVSNDQVSYYPLFH
jgi:outer membrane protein assembly factor BamB